jgi:hypothetical protein
MVAGRFFRYVLRTTDMKVARAFYRDVLGGLHWDCELCITPLPERAAAQGAPPHWLGHLSVNDPEEMAGQMTSLGGQRLGPAQAGTGGSVHVVVRDPFGAIVAVNSGARNAEAGGDAMGSQQGLVAWHLHHSQDHERSFAWYAGLFGWRATEVLDLGPEMGCHQQFAWEQSGPSVGSMTKLARLPHIHSQWLFFFRVPDIESSLARVRAHGGTVVGTTQTSTGDLVAPCEDPQGGAFGLYQVARENKF